MVRFTIRDLLWLMVVAGLLCLTVSWGRQHSALKASAKALNAETAVQRQEINDLKERERAIIRAVEEKHGDRIAEWSVWRDPERSSQWKAELESEKPSTAEVQSIYATPVTVFDAWREAAAKRDWRSYFDCLTPQTQNNMMFELVFQLGLAAPEKKANFDTKKFFDDKPRPSFDQKFKEKFGIDHATFREKRFTDPNIAAMEAAEHQLLCDDIAERVRDKAGFFEAVSNLLDRGDYEPLGELKQVTVEGDTASGQAEAIFKSWLNEGVGGVQKEVRERYDKSFHFRKVNGKWLIEF